MRRFKGLILALSCATLLLLQMVGLHLHSGAAAGVSGLHAEHVHGADPDGHDHSADVDVALVELGAYWVKLAPLELCLPLFFLPFLLICWLSTAGPGAPSVPRVPGGRWPPLRAPPASC
ncbi:MAG: hypothetical protein AB7I04_06090 [Pseudomonadales bacterium]